MPPVFEILITELERPRELSPQVIKHLGSHHDVDREKLGGFLANALSRLEDFEIDLILSPLFTPALADQAVFAEALGRAAIPASEWPALVRQLAERPTRAPLVTADGQTHLVMLREVTIERYVHRLRLEATVPEPLFRLLTSLPPAADRPLLKAVARRAIWESEARRQILVRHLTTAAGSDDYRLDDVVELLKVVETYEPTDAADLLSRIPHWQQVLRHGMSLAASPKAFFNERVQELHGGGRDQRRTDDARIHAKERELAFLDRLEKTLAA